MFRKAQQPTKDPLLPTEGSGGASSTDSDEDGAPAFQWRQWRPSYGIGLALLLVAGDALLYPGEFGLTAGAKILLCVGVALTAATFFMAWRPVRNPWIVLGAATLAGILVAMVTGDWFGTGAEAPAWRDVIVPSLDVLILAGAMVTWYAGRREQATVLLVAGVVASGMIFYGQQAAPAWALVVAILATIAFLAPSVSPYPRSIGIAAHGLAVLGAAQAMPGWFSWTTYPFLTLFPVYLAAVYFREQDLGRRIAWWAAVGTGALLTLLGTSTLIGNARRDLPVLDSLTMFGIGAVVLAAFVLLEWTGRRTPTPSTPTQA